MGKKGFTLAEVLITLGIIGIVAAMTLPALISNFRGKAAAAKIKKFYSIMQQAVVLSEQDNGPSRDWIATFSENPDAQIYYDKYLAPYLSTLVIKKEHPSWQEIILFLTDGSGFTLSNGACADFNYFLDANNIAKRKNNANIKGGREFFTFLICPKGSSYSGGREGFWPKVQGGNDNCRKNRNCLKEHCKTPYPDGDTCTGLLQYDNWEFKNDYPYKF